MSKIYIVRHGETLWNKEQRSQGKGNDIPLSEMGIAQAEALGKKLHGEKIDLFYSSSLKRAFDTASIIAESHNKDVTKFDEFMEMNFGCWEGLRFPEIVENYKEIYNIWRDRPHMARIPMGESILELKERSLGKLMEIIKENEGKNILIVSHGITIKTMIAGIMGIDLSNLHKIRQDNTALNILEYKDEKFYLNLLNDTCHIMED